MTESGGKVDQRNPTPLYKQLANILAADIESGKYKPDQIIPSQSCLQREHGVSRSTVQSAIQQLKKHGLVYALRSHGTFVARPKE